MLVVFNYRLLYAVSISTKVMKKNIGTQDNPESVDVEFVKIELYDKLKAIECLNKMSRQPLVQQLELF